MSIRFWHCLIVLLLPVHLIAEVQGTVNGLIVNEACKPIPNAQVYVLEKKQFVGHRLLPIYETDSSGKFLAENLPCNLCGDGEQGVRRLPRHEARVLQ